MFHYVGYEQRVAVGALVNEMGQSLGDCVLLDTTSSQKEQSDAFDGSVACSLP
jgi:hypothetical protein